MIGTTASSFIVRLPLPERVAAAMAGNKVSLFFNLSPDQLD
jgi:hypothetical protein